MRIPHVLAILLVWTGVDVAAQDAPFRHVVIDTDGPVDPWGKSFGDLNGDGKPDLIVGGSKSGGLIWYENPNWKKRMIAEGGQWSTDHEAVDVDRDGDLDVVALTKKTVCWLENPTWKLHEIDRRVLHDIEVADFDGDGDLDLVARNQGNFGHKGNELHFYRQDTASTWVHHPVACLNGEGLAVADMDRDGDADVVINAVWIENTGRFQPKDWKEYRYGERWIHGATFVALSDLNGDGRTDVVLAPSELANGRYRISWFEAPPDPRTAPWPEHAVAPDVETVHHFVGAADFDLDGNMDVVTAEMEQGADPDEITLYRNSGNQQTWDRQVIAKSGSHSMRILDVDGDGDSDLFGANWQGQTVDLWINESAARRAEQVWKYIPIDDARAMRSFGIASGDMDGDGDQDIASGQYIYRNPGNSMTGEWKRQELAVHIDANFILDVDGDDQCDILAQRLPDLIWLEADDHAASSFNARTVATGLGVTGHGSSQGFALGDITGDGRMEYVVTAGDGIHYLTIPEKPSNLPWPKVHVTDRAPEEGVALGDMDGDGAPDIVAWMGTGSGSNEVGWWRNPQNTTAEWVYSKIGMVEGAEGDRVAAGDFNQDGRVDVAATGTTNKDRGSNVYWFENGVGQEWICHNVATDVGAMNSMSVADVDGDGDADIVTGEHRGAKRVIVWRNRGHGARWTADEVDSGKESHLGAKVADLDGDGDLDILSIGWDDYKVLHLWRNDRITR